MSGHTCKLQDFATAVYALGKHHRPSLVRKGFLAVMSYSVELMGLAVAQGLQHGLVTSLVARLMWCLVMWFPLQFWLLLPVLLRYVHLAYPTSKPK